MPQPMIQYQVVSLSDSESISLGDTPPIHFDGSHSFTIAGFVRINDDFGFGQIFCKGEEFQITVDGTTLSAILSAPGGAAGNTVTSTVALVPGEWQYIAVAYATTGANAGTLSIYVNGCTGVQQALTNAGTIPTTAAFTIGLDLRLDVLSLSMWNIALSGSDILPSWSIPAAGTTGLVAAYDFAVTPPADQSGNNYPITTFASQYTETPSLALSDFAYATPSAADALNPGGTSASDPFSVCAWVNAAPPGETSLSSQYTVFATGPMSGPGFAGYLTWNATSSLFTWNAQLGSSPTALPGTTTVAPDEWHNVAATYDGTRLTVYVDGIACGTTTTVTVSALATPSVTIGAVVDPTNGIAGYSGYFQGYVQALQVWSTALSQSDLQTYMATDPTGVAGCAANFRFATDDAFNGVTSTPVSLLAGAVLTELEVEALANAEARIVASAPLRRRPADAAVSGGLSAFHRAAAKLGIDGSVRPKSTVIPEEHLDRAIASFERTLERAPDSVRDGLRATFHRNLNKGIALTESKGELWCPGMVLPRKEGAKTYLYLHTETGMERVMQLGADQCANFWISFFVSCVSVVLAFVGVGFEALKLGNFIGSVLLRGQKYLIDGVKTILKSASKGDVTSTLKACLTGLRFLSGATSMTSLFWEILSGLKWYSAAFTVLNVAASVGAIILSGGAYLAAIGAQVAFQAISLGLLIWDNQQCWSTTAGVADPGATPAIDMARARRTV